MNMKDGATLIGKLNNASDLVKAVADVYKTEGKSEQMHDLTKAAEVKAAIGSFETKANEVVHTTNTGYGAELIPGAVQMTDFLDLAPKMSSLLSAFRGFHGRNLNKIEERPIIGELALHQLAGEWTTGAPYTKLAQGLGKLPTGKVTLTQKKLLFSVDVSDEEQNYATIIDVVAAMQTKLAQSSARTTVSAIINGDTDTTLNTNINLIDGTPTGVEHYLACNGLRKLALASATTSFDAGTLAFADFLAALAQLGENANPEDVIFLLNRATYLKAMDLIEFKDASQNGRSSVITTGAITNFLGSDVFVDRYMTKANTAGKISATPANNSKGAFMAIHRDAVQYGYGKDYQIELFRVPGFGWQILGYYYLGASIVDGTGVGSDPLVSEGYNITV